MKNTNWLLSGAAALLLGCGGDTTATKPSTVTSPAKSTSSSTPSNLQPKAKDAVKLPPADVPEPPPPKAVTDKDKSKDKQAAPADDLKAPAPVPKTSTPTKKD